MVAFPLDVDDGIELRRLTPDDARTVFDVVVANRERLAPWMPWANTPTVEDQRAWLERVSADPEDLDGLGIFVAGRYVGGAGIHGKDAYGMVAEIGYWIDAAYEGRGIVTRVTRSLVDVCFHDLGLHRVQIRAGVENARSRSIPDRLGFIQEGVMREAQRGAPPHGFYDLVVYGLLEDEWPSPT